MHHGCMPKEKSEDCQAASLDADAENGRQRHGSKLPACTEVRNGKDLLGNLRLSQTQAKFRLVDHGVSR